MRTGSPIAGEAVVADDGSAVGRSPVDAALRVRRWPADVALVVANTLAVLIVAGALYWLQPGVLSAPYDGVFTYLNMVQTFQWQPSGQLLGGYYPLEGMGSRLMPSVPALQPQLISYWLVSDPGARVWLTYLILTGLLAAATLTYFRAAGVSRGVAVAATWLSVVLSIPGSDLAHATWSVVSAQVGMLVALTIFLQIGNHGQTNPLGARASSPPRLGTETGRAGSPRSQGVFWAIAFALFIVAFLMADHVFNGFLACPVLGVALLASTVGARDRSEWLWKLGTLFGTALLVLALGIPQWMLALANSISRAVFFDEILAQPQYARNAGMIFRSTNDFAIVYVLAIVGAICELVYAGRQRRILAGTLALLSAGLAVGGTVWLTTDLRWRGPAPAYFNVFLFPWLALAAIRGLSWLMTRRPAPTAQGDTRGDRERMDRRPFWLAAAAVPVAAYVGLKLLTGTATALTLRLVAATIGAALLIRLPSLPRRLAAPAVWAFAIVLVLFNGEAVRWDWWRGGVQLGADDGRNGVQQVFAVTPPFTRTLKDRVGLTPGSQFRGYADSLVLNQRTPMAVPLEILAWHGQDIPTLSQYTYFLTPELHLLVTRLLDDPTDHPNVNHLSLSRVDLRIMRMLGLRYLMLKDNLDLPGLTRVDRQGDYRLYELSDPNLASFSPTRVRRAPGAAGLLDTLADPAFDPRADVAIQDGEDVPSDLVPATATSLTFVPGGWHFSARSSGRSLVVLPVQFTRCLDLLAARGSAESARLLRVNLVETGILFTGDVEIDARYRAPGPWDRCTQDDIVDTERLRTKDLVRHSRLPEYSHPGTRLPIFAPLGLD